MRKYYIIALVLLAVAIAVVQQRPRQEQPGPFGQELPARIADLDKPGEYRWIAESELTDQFGFLDMELLKQLWVPAEPIAKLHEEALAAFNAGTEPPPCYSMTVGYYKPLPIGLTGNLNGLVAQSDAVVSGTVVAKQGGFFGGLPGVVLQVQVDEWLAAREDFEKTDTLLVAYGGGEVSVGMATICVATQGLPPAPAVGDKVMLFSDESAEMPGVPYINFFSGHLRAGVYWSAATGSMHTSATMARYLPSVVRSGSFDALRSEVKTALAGGGAP